MTTSSPTQFPAPPLVIFVILAAVAVAMALIWAAAAVPAMMGAPSAYLVGNLGECAVADDGDLGLVSDLGDELSPVGDETEQPCNSGGSAVDAKGLGTPFPELLLDSTELGLDTIAAEAVSKLCNARTAAAVPEMMGALPPLGAPPADELEGWKTFMPLAKSATAEDMDEAELVTVRVAMSMDAEGSTVVALGRRCADACSLLTTRGARPRPFVDVAVDFCGGPPALFFRGLSHSISATLVASASANDVVPGFLVEEVREVMAAAAAGGGGAAAGPVVFMVEVVLRWK